MEGEFGTLMFGSLSYPLHREISECEGREQEATTKPGGSYHAPKHHSRVDDCGVHERDGVTKLVGVSSPRDGLRHS